MFGGVRNGLKKKSSHAQSNYYHIPPNLVVERVTTHRKPPEVRIWRLSNQSRVGTVPPSTSTPHCPHAEPDAGRVSGYTGGPVLSETPVGFRLDGESLSWQTASARWHYGPDPRACWSPASGGLRGRHTSPLWWVEARRVAI